MDAKSKTILNAGAVLRNTLLHDGKVAAITGDIYPVLSPKDNRLPYIAYRRTAGAAVAVKDHASRHISEIEFWCWTQTYDEGLELAEAVIEALDGKWHEFDGLRIGRCRLTDTKEDGLNTGDAFVQVLTFEIAV